MKKFLIILLALTLTAPCVQAEITYSEDIAPIIQRECQSCHRQGEVAPFALTGLPRCKSMGNGDRRIYQSTADATLETGKRLRALQK